MRTVISNFNGVSEAMSDEALTAEIMDLRERITTLAETINDLYARPPMEHSDPNWHEFALFLDIPVPNKLMEGVPRWALPTGGEGGDPGRPPNDGSLIQIITGFLPQFGPTFITIGWHNVATPTSLGMEVFSYEESYQETTTTDWLPQYATITTGELGDYQLLTQLGHPLIDPVTSMLPTEDLGTYLTSGGTPTDWSHTGYNSAAFTIFEPETTTVGYYYELIP